MVSKPVWLFSMYQEMSRYRAVPAAFITVKKGSSCTCPQCNVEELAAPPSSEIPSSSEN